MFQKMHSDIFDLLRNLFLDYCQSTNKSYLNSEFPLFLEWFFDKYLK